MRAPQVPRFGRDGVSKSMTIREILTDEVAYPPKFGSPTALAIQAGEFIFVSGMMPWDCDRKLVGGSDVKAQTRQALKNLELTLKAAGSELRQIVKINFFVTDIRDKTAIWEVRKEVFGGHRCASTLVQVSQLVDPLAHLEVEAIAYVRAIRSASV